MSEPTGFRISGKFKGGCLWVSQETFATREEAEATRERWKLEHPTPNEWTRVVSVHPVEGISQP